MMGKQIYNYYIEKLIREEWMGTVYLAVDVPSNKQVVLRLLNPALVGKVLDQDLLKNYNTLVSLNHASIGKFYSWVKQADQFYLVSEFIPGVTLREYMAAPDRLFSEEKIWDLFMQLIEAFDYAHTKGVNHFTINPDSIIIAADEKVKVIDFGIAGLFTDFLSKESIELNKVQYRSPEQIQGRGLDARSDIYALGVIFFELLTRQSPYPSVLSATDIKHKIIHHTLPPVKLYTLAFTHSYSMQAIIDKATAKNPAYRFQNFQELKQSFLEENDERETMMITHLMQEVNQRSQQWTSKNFSAIKMAKQKKQRKRIGQVFLVVALMAGVIAIGFKIHTSSSALEGLIGFSKDAQTGNTSDKRVIQEKNNTTKFDKNGTPAPIIDNKDSSEQREVPDLKSVHSSVAGLQPEKKESAIARAGFSAETNADNNYSRLHLEHRLEGFYAVLQSKDLDQTHGYYAPTLRKFFNENNVNEKQLHKLLQKAWKRTPEDKHEILWDTFQYSQDREGNYIMEFYMNYIYRRANRTAWRSRKIYTMIKMDKDCCAT